MAVSVVMKAMDVQIPFKFGGVKKLARYAGESSVRTHSWRSNASTSMNRLSELKRNYLW